ncbi:hypothetical protein NPIL_302481 [Nephila pilipes]|uniref:Uncharacterized protein n=1 Tax=Nephila pilipes TaxID=299642 RepID=A0A8X6QFS5_NEPPI|nr:hypothetical protein NPIL_302481 [Nephila pilipes]
METLASLVSPFHSHLISSKVVTGIFVVNHRLSIYGNQSKDHKRPFRKISSSLGINDNSDPTSTTSAHSPPQFSEPPLIIAVLSLSQEI